MFKCKSHYFFLFLIVSCSTSGGTSPEDTKSDHKPFAFFVAGHVYGAPFGTNVGVHEPFVEKFELITEDSTMAFGVLTGDIVKTVSEASWNKADSIFALLNRPVYYIPGNHDITSLQDRRLFEDRYQKTYYSFVYQSSLFIMLDTTLDNGNILNDQWHFLQGQLDSRDDIKHVFIFFHHVVWMRPDNMFRNVAPNNQLNYNILNFWSEIVPLLESLDQEVYLFSGDIGAWALENSVHYYRDQNLHFIGSGMGGGKHDNFIIVNVMNQKIDLRLIAINSDNIESMGTLENHLLSYTLLDRFEILSKKLKYFLIRLYNKYLG